MDVLPTESNDEFMEMIANRTQLIVEAITKDGSLDKETAEKIAAQTIYCKINSSGEFYAPHTTRSWCCGRNIWERITLKEATTKLITGCPYCNRSFVD